MCSTNKGSMNKKFRKNINMVWILHRLKEIILEWRKYKENLLDNSKVFIVKGISAESETYKLYSEVKFS